MPGLKLIVGIHVTQTVFSFSKASGGDGIPVELFEILKDDAVKVLHSICQQVWKIPSSVYSYFSWHHTRGSLLELSPSVESCGYSLLSFPNLLAY